MIQTEIVSKFYGILFYQFHLAQFEYQLSRKLSTLRRLVCHFETPETTDKCIAPHYYYGISILVCADADEVFIHSAFRFFNIKFAYCAIQFKCTSTIQEKCIAANLACVYVCVWYHKG